MLRLQELQLAVGHQIVLLVPSSGLWGSFLIRLLLFCHDWPVRGWSVTHLTEGVGSTCKG